MNLESTIFFKHVAYTSLDEHIRLIGNIPSIGNWDTDKGIVFETDTQKYPEWHNKTPIQIPKNTIIEFKFAIFKGNQLVRWEELENRKYKTKQKVVELKSEFNSVKGSQIILQKFDTSLSSMLSITELSSIKKVQNKGLNPFDQANDTDSENGDVGTLGSIFEINSITQNKNKQTNQSTKHFKGNLIIEEVIEEIEGIKNSGSSDKTVPKSLQTLIKKIQNNQSKHQTYSKHDIIYEEVFDTFISLAKNDELIIVLWYPIYVYIEQNQIKDCQPQQISDYHLIEGLKNQQFKHTILAFTEFIDEKGEKVYQVNENIVISLRNEFCIIPMILSEENQLLKHEFDDKYQEMLMQPNLDFNHVDLINSLYEMCMEINHSIFQNLDIIRLKSDSLQKTISQEQKGQKFIFLYNLLLHPIVSLICQTNSDLQIAIYWNFESEHSLSLHNVAFLNNIMKAALNTNVIIFNDIQKAYIIMNYLRNNYHVQIESLRGILHIKHLGRRIFIRLSNPSISTDKKYETSLRDSQIVSFHSKIECLNILSIYTALQFKSIIHQLQMMQQLRYYKQLELKFTLVIYFNSGSQIYDEKLAIIHEMVGQMKQQGFQLVLRIIDVQEIKGLNSIWERRELYKNHEIYWQANINTYNDYYLQEYIYHAGPLKSALISTLSVFCQFIKGVIKYNPFEINDFYNKFTQAANQCITQQLKYYSIDQEAIQKHNTKKWIESIMIDLKHVMQMSQFAQIIWYDQIKMGLDLHLNYLNEEKVIKSMKNKQNKVIIIELDSLLDTNNQIQSTKLFLDEVEQFEVQTKKIINIDPRIIEALKQIEKNGSNQVHIISQHQKSKFVELECLESVYLSAENGYYCKDPESKKWNKLAQDDYEWKQKIKNFFENYVTRTDGSWIEQKESSITINFQNVLVVFAEQQIDQLLQNLKFLIEQYQNLNVISGENFVTVRSSYINQSVLTYSIIQKESISKKIDCVLAIGRTIEFEGVFQTLDEMMKQQNFLGEQSKTHLICGECRPTRAQMYYTSTAEIIDLLNKLN